MVYYALIHSDPNERKFDILRIETDYEQAKKSLEKIVYNLIGTVRGGEEITENDIYLLEHDYCYQLPTFESFRIETIEQ